MKKNNPNILVTIFLKIAFVIFVIGILNITSRLSKNQDMEYKSLFQQLKTLEPQSVTTFRIYPRVSVASGTPVIFNVSGDIVKEFFQSLDDTQPYRYNHDTVDSSEHSWALEVGTSEHVLHVSFHIPSGKGDIVVGEIVHRYFQSHALQGWYQKYKGQWLETHSKK